MKRLVAVLLFFLLTLVALPVRSEEPLKLGMLAYRPKEQIAAQWQPLAVYLETAIGQRVEVKVYDYKELNVALDQNKVDVLLTNPGHYVLAKHRLGLSAPLATLVNKEGKHELKAFGGVIFTRAEEHAITSLASLAGRRIAAVSRDSLGGYQMQAVELLDARAPLPEEGELLSTGMPHDRVVKAVLEGKADAGFVRTGLLESLASEGKLDLGRIKIINRQNLPAFPFASSTRLYPEWPVAVMPHIDEHLSQRLTIALLTLSSDSVAARTAMIHGFITPASYDSVEDMLQRLRMPPYDIAPEFTLADLWKKYSAWIVAVALLAFLLIAMCIWLLLIFRARAYAMKQLAASEERWSFALEGAGDGVWDWDFQTGKVTLSKAGAAMFGYAEGEVGNDVSFWYAQLDPGDATRWDDMLRNFFRSNASRFSLEYQVRCKDGSYKWVLTRGMVVSRSPDGRVLRMIGVHTDITERKQIEGSLRSLTAAIEQSTASVVITDLDANIQYVNPGFIQATGYSYSEAIGKNPRILKSGQMPKEIYADLWSKLSSGKEWHGELLNKRRNGELYWEDARIAPVKNAAGAVTHYVAVKIDITMQKQAEAKLRDSEVRFRTLFNSIGDIVLVHPLTGQDGRLGQFIEANDAAFEQLGYSREELFAMTPLDLDEPGVYPSREDVEAFKCHARETGHVMFERVHVAKNGRRIPVEISLHVFELQGVEMMLSVVRDITERKHYIEGLHKAQELAEEIATAKSSFLANMSHEIRTPMNAIIGLTQLALNKHVSSQVRNYLEKILNSSTTLLEILNDILDLSRIEAGRVTIEQASFNLGSVMENLNSLFAMRAEEKLLDFSIKAAPDVPLNLVGDALRLQQILSNLVGNAIKFTGQGKVALEISLKEASNDGVTLLFRVEDTGIGIAEENMGKLFQPFSQVDSSITRRFGGSGLGLAISNDLLRLMGGSFHVESILGKGTTFSFELVFGLASSAVPALVDRRKRQRKAGALSSSLRSEGLKLAGARILVVEDDTASQEVVSEFLELAGVTVITASNGKEALDLLDQGAFDAVLMDVHMPVMNGIESVQRIRAQHRFDHLPVIAMSADAASEAQEHYLGCGMNDLVAKPVDPRQLITTLVHWAWQGKEGIAVTAAASANASHQEQMEQSGDALLGNMPGFDLGNVLEMVGGNSQEVARLLLSFMDSMADVPGEIEAKAKAGDFNTARELAHKLKGVAGNLGATSLHAATGRLEGELKAGRHDPATFTAFLDEFNRTMFAISGLRQVKIRRQAPASNARALAEIAREIDALLEENSFVPAELLDEFRASLPASKQEQFDMLQKYIGDIQYAKARQALHALAESSSVREP